MVVSVWPIRVVRDGTVTKWHFMYPLCLPLLVSFIIHLAANSGYGTEFISPAGYDEDIVSSYHYNALNGDVCRCVPQREVEVMSIWSDEIETEVANTGENVKLKIKNAEEEDIMPGFVVCSPDNLCRTGSVFDAQVGVCLI